MLAEWSFPKDPEAVIQKQPAEVLYEKWCFSKFRKIHRKTPVPEKHLCQNLFFIISLIFIKKEVTLSQVPSSAFCETNSSFLAEQLLVTASGY